MRISSWWIFWSNVRIALLYPSRKSTGVESVYKGSERCRVLSYVSSLTVVVSFLVG